MRVTHTQTVAVCSTLAIATALMTAPQQARAQSFNGTGTVVAGSATINTGPGATDVTVSGNAVINWAPSDTATGLPPILFQNAGTTATFDSPAAFTVLNRILPVDPTRAVQFDGTILGRVGAGAPIPGGTVYFYSPGGIIASGTSVFDVGNLGLTTSPVVYDAATGVFDNAGLVSFQPANAGSSVNIQAGAQLTGIGYVAVVSPVVSNAGTITLNAPVNVGTGAALVAADAADITFNVNGLFDIAVTQGTSAAGTVLTNSGSIGGATAGAPGGSHKVYLVAIPQNQAITMAIASGSTLGFDIADAVDVAGNTVILSAGQDVVSGLATGVPSGSGGTGPAGIAVQGGGINVTSALNANATGTVLISATSGGMSFASDVTAAAAAGTRAEAIGINSAVAVGGDLTLDATATGIGGPSTLLADASGQISVGGTALVYASGFGANAAGAGVAGGLGQGGTASVTASGNGSMTLNRLFVFADGVGGQALITGSGSGDAIAGTANLTAITGGSINVGTTIDLTAEGFSGNGNGCLTCTLDSGNATGGTANLLVDGGTISSVGDFRMSVRAIAGNASGAGAGSATGGTYNGNIPGGGMVNGVSHLIDISGTGGTHTAAGLAGSGTGGTATFFAGGLGNPAFEVDAVGQGGDSLVAGGIAGSGSGGSANITIVNGAFGSVLMNSGGFGGNAALTGGNGTGGTAQLNVGTVSVSGAFDVLAHGAGGLGTRVGSIGGIAQGGTARMVGSAGGSMTAASNINVDASAFGGSGTTGGAATGGTADLAAFNNSINAPGATVSVNADGGAGGLGAGGNAQAGNGSIFAGNNVSGPSSITLTTGQVNAVGVGGNGGAGLNLGDAGFAGGSGTGGRAIITAAAGNGAMSITTASTDASGIGGRGGDGAAGSAGGNGGAGGQGGIGTGGLINLGSESGAATPQSSGTASFGSVTLSSQGFGGDGGNGGLGGGGVDGAGGAGGNAAGGPAVLLVRGTPVSISGTANLAASAFGGAGGTGSVAGVGGNAVVGDAGGVGVLVTNRFQVPTQRGTLTAGAILGVANATGGTGSVNGTATMGASPLTINLVNSDATIDSIDFFSSAGTLAGGIAPSASAIDVAGGTLNVAGRLGFVTTQDVSLTIDNGAINAGFADIIGQDWVLGTTPVAQGTLTATSGVNFVTTNNLLAHANLVLPSSTVLTAPGSIQFGGVVVTGSLLAQAGGGIALGNVAVSATTDLIAGGAVTAGTIDSAGYLNIESLGAVTTGALASGEYIEVDSLGGGATISGTVDAGDHFSLQSNGNAVVGNITAGIFNISADPLATYTAAIAANGNVTTGSIQAQFDIGLLAVGGTITTASLSGRDLLVMAGTGATINGAVSASARLAFVNASYAALGGNLETFDKEAVFAALPFNIVATSAATFGIDGPITVNGPLSAGSLRAYTRSSFTATNSVGVNGTASIASSGSLSVAGNLDGGFIVGIAGGPLSAANVTSRSTAALFAGVGSGPTNSSIGNVTAGGPVLLGSSGNLTVGNIISDPAALGLPATATTPNIAISAGGNVVTGNLRSARNAAVAAGQDIRVGQVLTRGQIALLPGGSLTAGNLLASPVTNATGQIIGATGDILIANPALATGAGGIFNLDYVALFAAPGQPIGGAITINGSTIGRDVRAYSAGDMLANGVAGFRSIKVESGGLVTVARQWGSPDIEIFSNDIDIRTAQASPTQPGAASGLNAGVTGEVTLFSTNPRGAFIGDGLAGSGYALSQREFSLINSGSLFVTAQDQPGNLIDMTIGDLAITGPQAGSTIDDPAGIVLFATGTRDAAGNGTPSGGLRITGNVAATGFLATNNIEFYADLFELDAGTGSVKIEGAPGSLSGNIYIEAQHIHIAESAILAKLEADPFYAGHIAELNRPAAVQRPGGVFNALAFDLYPTATLYIQNTGTTFVPAGFLVGPDADVTPEPGQGETVETVINGQFVTDTGIISGRAAYDALLGAQPDFTGFSARSQLNGCLFIGGCVVSDPVANVASEIQMLIGPSLADTPAVEDEPDDDEAEAQKTAEEAVDGSPIAPPAPLIDTRPLNPPVIVTEPVAGSGNPALIGSAVNEATAQGEPQ